MAYQTEFKYKGRTVVKITTRKVFKDRRLNRD